MAEVKLKTHLITTDVHEEFTMKWCGRILDARPLIKDGKPLFIVVGTKGRVETDTVDMAHLEKIAKLLTRPKGKEAIISDTARIYIREENGNDKLLGVMTHKTIKTFAPMYDNFQKI